MMKVEIWSDIRCPFCYIGKRKFENALQQFEHSEEVEIKWRSFELDPLLRPVPNMDIYTYLAEVKGIRREQSVQMHQQVTQMAAEAGLEFKFDKTLVANSFDAHRLIQLAKTYHLADEAEELLFKAYFTDGMDISDHKTLIYIGVTLGLEENLLKEMLTSGTFAEEVQADEQLAVKLGIRGVPFFLIDDRLAVSGAQPTDAFLNSLQAAWKENRASQPAGNSDQQCSTEGDC